MNALALILTLLLVTVVPVSAQDTLPSLFGAINPSVGALYAQSTDGSLAFNCTVTAVDHDGAGGLVLLTANHCVSKGTSYLVSFDGKQFHAAHVYKLPKEEVDSQKHKRRYGEPKVDMAFFLVKEATGIPLVPLGNDAGVTAGTRIVVIGFPMGIAKISYEGLVAGRLERPGADQDGYLLLQSWGAPGSSGSAVIDAKTGTVIGVLVSAQQGGVGLPVIFATPISYKAHLKEVLE